MGAHALQELREVLWPSSWLTTKATRSFQPDDLPHNVLFPAQSTQANTLLLWKKASRHSLAHHSGVGLFANFSNYSCRWLQKAPRDAFRRRMSGPSSDLAPISLLRTRYSMSQRIPFSGRRSMSMRLQTHGYGRRISVHSLLPSHTSQLE